MSPDDQDWGEYQPDDESSDEGIAHPTEASSAGSAEPARQSKCKTGSSKSHNAAAPLPRPQGQPKLRTASDVLHRLRWDPGMSSDDFAIGYTDRHLAEPQEKAVGAWKLEQTHEEFIPQHRILYFRRKSDGMLVWERSSRTDMRSAAVSGSSYGLTYT
ncbi:DUF455 domain-containing protein [Verticillium alfalfae VaMs.102]|uniref:DUF455 domain-containing protein n=1 Tax=Verticillium alfalfae (strain VaMs.102 / ATCC MYA-4576 / FGSC 10136) TaxID=526221 RepID=C9SJ51_VERA1|nr:DUF455 domain-containing protein [Verticillium alfalfae VaMs.102]EEY18213.1 DUF455 domain-containing protein [Verticillium alfalfae VaMs.102]